ncbi:hypothetical protein [Spirosoma rhododendri]|uniref:Uncharacterized protein n=1 Tax=Spirosoma rhododendri TaxID=2728024 RepID=A0A7L5DHD2_9BACT|nr:hypothetical protein [Spirosoma rhododendri]QJD77744.1 hypothetical protein HH216_04390 [Spirosoma rhododendri]
MLTLLLTALSLVSQPNSTAETASTAAVGQYAQQPQPRRSGRRIDQTKPLPDTTQKKGRPKQPASVDSLRRGGATRVDTVRA